MPVPFGSTAALVSDFTGPNEDPLSEGGNWARGNPASAPNCTRVGNQCGQSGPTNFTPGQYWTPATWGPGMDAYITVVTVPTVGVPEPFSTLAIRATNLPSVNWTGYQLNIRHTSHTWLLIATSGTGVIASAAGPTVAAGDKIGIRAFNNWVQGYHYTAGAWTLVLEVLNTQFQTAGTIMLGQTDNASRYDDIFVGTVPAQVNNLLPILGAG